MSPISKWFSNICEFHGLNIEDVLEDIRMTHDLTAEQSTDINVAAQALNLSSIIEDEDDLEEWLVDNGHI